MILRKFMSTNQVLATITKAHTYLKTGPHTYQVLDERKYSLGVLQSQKL